MSTINPLSVVAKAQASEAAAKAKLQDEYRDLILRLADGTGRPDDDRIVLDVIRDLGVTSADIEADVAAVKVVADLSRQVADLGTQLAAEPTIEQIDAQREAVEKDILALRDQATKLWVQRDNKANTATVRRTHEFTLAATRNKAARVYGPRPWTLTAPAKASSGIIDN